MSLWLCQRCLIHDWRSLKLVDLALILNLHYRSDLPLNRIVGLVLQIVIFGHLVAELLLVEISML